MLFINASNREKHCYNIAKDLMMSEDQLISLAGKDLKYCLGCNSCKEKLETRCILKDFITNIVYSEIDRTEEIIIVCPLYMSQVTGRLKTLIDRLYPYYNHGGLNNKNIYLILTGYGSKEDNNEEINSIIRYFEGISEWLYFNFTFLDYFCTNYDENIDDCKNTYSKKIEKIKSILKL